MYECILLEQYHYIRELNPSHTSESDVFVDTTAVIRNSCETQICIGKHMSIPIHTPSHCATVSAAILIFVTVRSEVLQPFAASPVRAKNPAVQQE